MPETQVKVEASVFSAALRYFARHYISQEAVGLLLDGSACSFHEKTNIWALLGVGERQRLTMRNRQLWHNTQSLGPLHADSLTQIKALLTQAPGEAAPEQGTADNLPFTGGWMGFIGYEAAPLFEPAWLEQEALSHSAFGTAQDSTATLPDLYWFEPKASWIFHLPSQQIWAFGSAKTQPWQAVWNGCIEQALYNRPSYNKSLLEKPSPQTLESYLAAYTLSLNKENYEEAVTWLQRKLREGEMFQANLSLRLQRLLPKEKAHPWALYEALQRRNPSPFAGLFKSADGWIVSSSPERLVRLGPDRLADTRPIAGTRGRGKNAEQEAALEATLRQSPKEQAEHQMLVDLERNDLGKVCVPGSVVVDEPQVLERYSHVTHLVSNVAGRLAPDKDALDLLAALTPGGTITGCPKLRCMQLLAEREPVPRGFYTGSLGYMDWQRQRQDWSILIRSLSLQPSGEDHWTLNLHAGAGIVIDSVGAHEYKESLRKAQALLEVIEQELGFIL